MTTKQEILDYLDNVLHPIVSSDNWNVYSELHDMIEDLPSAEPQWILCSERMPEEREWIGTKEFGTTISDEVYVTFKSPKGQRFCKHLSFQNGKIPRYDQMEIDLWYKGSIPIAWMPLPELYEGEC